MKKFTLINHEKQTQEIIESPLTIKTWLAIHFGAWGFYKINHTSKKQIDILNAFTGEICYTILL